VQGGGWEPSHLQAPLDSDFYFSAADGRISTLIIINNASVP
jgi:hypothetical protein